MTVVEERIEAAPGAGGESERRTSYLELFFDLVFVFAITQVTTLILAQPTAGGFARATLALGLVWWAWSGFAWLTNAVDVESMEVRFAMLAATLGSFFVALAVPHAFDSEGTWFALPYLAVRLLHVALYLRGLRDEPEHRAAMFRLAPWFSFSPVVVLVGGLIENVDGRTALWTLAVAVDIAGVLRARGFKVSPAHFAERYALFVIIALGESIVAIGVGAAEEPRDLTFAVAVVVAFAGACALWWAYFDFTALAAERSLRFASPEERGHRARDVFTFFHFFQVLGIIFFAVAAKKMLASPLEPLGGAGRAALILGGGLPLLAPVLGRYRVIRRIAWERVGGIVLVLAAGLILYRLAGVWLLLTVDALLAGTITTEMTRLREARRQIRADGPPTTP